MKKIIFSFTLLAVSTTVFANPICDEVLNSVTELVTRAKTYTQDKTILANLDKQIIQTENHIKRIPEEKKEEECKNVNEQIVMLKTAVAELENAAKTAPSE